MCQHFRRSITRFLAHVKKEEQESAWHTYHLRATTEILPPKIEKTTEELVPEEYHKFLKVFSKGESEHMLLRKPWDHAIGLKDTFQPKRVTSFPYPQQNRKKFPPLLMTSYGKAVSNRSNQNKHPQSSLSQRRMARNGWYRIIATSMSTQ